MRAIHSPACDRLLTSWQCEPSDSIRRRLADDLAHGRTDSEIRDVLLTIFDEDPADSEPVAAAHELWPLLVFGDPMYSPEELSDELDVLTRDYDLMRMRVEAMAAKFRALDPWSNRWDRYPHEQPLFGEQECRWAAMALDALARSAAGFPREQLNEAREHAANIRVHTEADER